MADVTRLTGSVSISGVSQAVNQLNALNDAGQKAAENLNKVGSAGTGLTNIFARVASGAVATAAGFALFKGVENVIGSVAGATFGLNDKLQQVSIGFETMTGSAAQAQALLAKLRDFAITSPFEFPDLARAGQRMLAVGFSAQSIVPSLTTLGNAMAATGGITRDILDRVTIAISQMQTKGRVLTQEMNQLTEAMIPAWKLMAEGLGVTTQQLQKMVSDGAVPAGVALQAMFKMMDREAGSGGFAGAMDRASQTFRGAMSNIKDAVSLVIADAFRPFFKLMNEGAVAIAKFVNTPGFKEFSAKVTYAMEQVAMALRILFKGDLQTFGELFERGARQAAGALLHLANEAMPVVVKGISILGNLAADAASWGANLAFEYAKGLMEGAGTAITAALTAIGNLIMSFFAGHSPPPKGPLKEIDTAGTLLMNTYLGGFTKADFSILDTISGAIEAILKKKVDLGSMDQTGLIPNLLGGQNAIADAIGQLKEFGQVSEDVFDRLRSFVGDGSEAVIELFKNLEKIGELDKEIDGLNKKIKELDGDTRRLEKAARDVKDRYQEQITVLERALKAAERYWEAQIKPAESHIKQLERMIQLREKELGLDIKPSVAERTLEVEVAKNDLVEAQNAHLERRKKLLNDLAKAQEDLAEAQGADKKDPGRISDAQRRVAEVLAKLETEGVQTAEDRLRIEKSKRDVLEAEAELRRATDPDIAAAEKALELEKDKLTVLEAQRDDAIDPMKAKLEGIKNARADELEIIDDELERIRTQREQLQGQIGDIEAQRDAIQENVDTTLARFEAEGQVAGKLREQLDLLERIAKEAENAAKKAGGAAEKGLGGLAGLTGGAGRLPELPPMPEIKLPKFDLEKEGAKLQTQIEDAIKGAFKGAFDRIIHDPTVIGVSAGALAGAIIGMFTPVGPLVGAGIGSIIGVGIAKAFPEIKKMLVGEDVILSNNLLDQMLGTDKKHVEGRFEEQFTNIRKIATDALKDLKSDVAPIIKDYIEYVKKNLETLQKWWEDHGENVGIIVQKLGTTLAVGFDLILKGLRPALKFLEDNFAETFKIIMGLVGVLVDLMAGDFDKVAADAMDFARQLGDALGITPIIEKVIDIVKEFGPKIAGFFQDAGSAIKTAWKTVTDFFSGEGSDAFKTIKDVIEKVGPALSDFGGFIKDIYPALQDFAGFIKNEVVTSLQNFGDFLESKVGPAILKLAKWFTDDILPPMTNTKDFINDQVVPAFKALAEFFTDKVVPAAQKVASFITDDLIPAWNSVNDTINDKVISALRAVKDFITDDVIPVLEKIVDYIKNNVVTTFNEWKDLITDDVIPILERAAGIIKDVFQARLEEISNFIDGVLLPIFHTVVDFLRNDWAKTIDNVTGIVGFFWDKLKDLGEMLSAIWQKAQDVGGVIKTWLTDKFEDAKNKAQEFLDKLGGPLGLIGLLAELLLKVNPISGPLLAIASGIDAVVGAIGRALGPLGSFASALGNIGDHLPGFVKGNSPPPLAIWLGQIGDSAEIAVPKLNLFGDSLAYIADQDPTGVLANAANATTNLGAVTENTSRVMVSGWETAKISLARLNDESDRAAIAAYEHAKAEGARQQALDESAAAMKRFADEAALAAKNLLLLASVPKGGWPGEKPPSGGGGTPGSSGFDLEKATAWINFVNSIIRPMQAAMAQAQQFGQTMANIANGLSVIEPAARGAASGVRELNAAMSETQVPEPLQMHSPPPLATAFDMVAASAQNASAGVAKFNSTLAAGAAMSTDVMSGLMATPQQYRFDQGVFGMDQSIPMRYGAGPLNVPSSSGGWGVPGFSGPTGGQPQTTIEYERIAAAIAKQMIGMKVVVGRNVLGRVVTENQTNIIGGRF